MQSLLLSMLAPYYAVNRWAIRRPVRIAGHRPTASVSEALDTLTGEQARNMAREELAVLPAGTPVEPGLPLMQ